MPSFQSAASDGRLYQQQTHDVCSSGTATPPAKDAEEGVTGHAWHDALAALVALMDAKPHAAHIPTLLTIVEDRFSNRDYRDNNESLPIARAAVAALAKVGPLSTSDAERMLETALKTHDFDLRRHILALFAIGSAEVQRHILRLALKKHPADVRRAAVAALLAAEASLDPTVIAAITPERLLRQAAPIASELTIVLGRRGDAAQVQAAAEALSASASRRIFVVALAAVRRDRDAAEAERLAAHLPEEHVGRTWALGHDLGEVAERGACALP